MAQRSSRSIGSRTPPSISNPIPQEPIIPMSVAKAAPSSSKPSSSTSTSPKPSSRLHRPSISSTMNWLGRSVSSASITSLNHTQQPHPAPKPIRISEPQLKNTFERSGPLGAGATVVRTPQEALAGTRKQDAVSIRSFETHIPEDRSREDRYEDEEDALAGSPPLPPLPLEDDVDEDEIEADARSVATRSSTPPRPTRPCPAAPPLAPEPISEPTTPASLRPSLKVLDSFPPVPALPANIPSTPPPPAFEPILLSAPPSGLVDPDRLLVMIETCTMTYKTTFATLTSRPSLLSSYLESILPPPPTAQSEDEESVYSRQSTVMDNSFNSIFRHHLTTSGLLPPSASTSMIHIFLDRPSAPYAHILSYLRSPLSTPEHPAVLPRPVQLTSSSSSRLEALLELRDEARCLDLDELYRMCSDELRARHYFGLARSSHTRGMSNASASTGSMRSLGTLRENDETLYNEEPLKAKRLSKDSGVGSSSSDRSSRRTRSPANSIVAEVGWHSPPPVSVLEERGRAERKVAPLRMKPATEWI